MKVISPCFTYNKNFSKPLIKSFKKFCNQNINDLILYGDGNDKNNRDFYYTKMLYASKLMKKLDDEIIILLDGFDGIVNKPLDGLIETFKNFNCNLLISAEANCFPLKEYEQFLSNKCETRLKFPCAGAWIGYREYMIELFDSPLAVENSSKWSEWTDQAFMETIYYYSLLDLTYSVKIDNEAKIFVNTYLLENEKDFQVNENKQLIYNEFNSMPYFVHFNGGGKKHMPLFGYKFCEDK